MKVLALIPTKDGIVHPETLHAVYKQDFSDYSALIHILKPVFLHQDPYKNKSLNILRNRIIMKKLALGSSAEWFFWVDSDTVPPVNAITEFLKCEKPLMGGWYPTVFNANWVAARWAQESVFEHFKAPLPGLTEVDLLGLGCAFMHRSVLEKVDFTAGTEEYVKGIDGASYYLGQCGTFCRDALVFGVKAVMVGNVVCKHIPTGPGSLIRGTNTF